MSDLASALNLRPAGPESYYGTVAGFPLLLKVIGPDESPICLFEVRFPERLASLAGTQLQFEGPLAGLIRDEKAEASIEKRSVWLTLNDAMKEVNAGTIIPIIRAFMDGLQKAGFGQHEGYCHYCLVERVDESTFAEGKALQICSGCKQQRIASPKSTPADLILLLLSCAVGSILGAVVWAMLWAGSDLLFQLLNTHTIVVPRILLAAVLLALGFVAAWPVLLAVKFAGQNGQRFVGLVAGAASLMSVILGDYFYVIWLLWREYKVVHVFGSLIVLPSIWLHTDFTKLLASLMAVGIAYALARKKPPVKL
jgi:hypothetical protein